MLRTLALPLSFLTLGLGFVPIITGRHRRALHFGLGELGMGTNILNTASLDSDTQEPGMMEVVDRIIMEAHGFAEGFASGHAEGLVVGVLGVAGAVDALLTRLPRAAIARKSYIHPAIIALIDTQQKWRAGLKLPRDALSEQAGLGRLGPARKEVGEMGEKRSLNGHAD